MISDFRRVMAQANGTSQGIAATETTPEQRRNAVIQVFIILLIFGATLYFLSKKS